MTEGPPQLRGRSVAVAAVTAAVVSALLYLLQRFGYHDDIGWVGVLICFVLLLFAYLGFPWVGPPVRRFFRGPRGE